MIDKIDNNHFFFHVEATNLKTNCLNYKEINLPAELIIKRSRQKNLTNISILLVILEIIALEGG